MKTRKMNINKSYLQKVKEFEGLRLTAYTPEGEKPTGIYTIGYGHFGARKGDVITETTAERMLINDIEQAYKLVLRVFQDNNMLDYSFTSDRMTALTDFVFNCGFVNLGKSTLLKRIKENPDDPRILFEFGRWTFSGKTKLKGLVKRREYEAMLWQRNKDVELLELN